MGIIGIIGGMGPEATAYFYELIIKNTAAAKDQEHIHVLIDSYPQIPPRTAAILGEGPSPLPYLLEAGRRLKRAGATLLVMPCITAHYYYAELTSRINLPFISLIEETRKEARRLAPRAKKVGLLASTGTVRSGLFDQALRKIHVSVLKPEAPDQEKVMEAIFSPQGIKAGFTKGRPRQIILAMANKLIAQGAEAIIAGCTEIPLVLKETDIPVPLLEPMAIGARACIRAAGYRVRQ